MYTITLNKSCFIKYRVINGKIFIEKMKFQIKDWTEIFNILKLIETIL